MRSSGLGCGKWPSVAPVGGGVPSPAFQFYNSNQVSVDGTNSTDLFPDQPTTPFVGYGDQNYDPLVGCEFFAFGWFEAMTVHSLALAIYLEDASLNNVISYSAPTFESSAVDVKTPFRIHGLLFPQQLFAPGVVQTNLWYETRVRSTLSYRMEDFAITGNFNDPPFRLRLGVAVGGNENKATLCQFAIRKMV